MSRFFTDIMQAGNVPQEFKRSKIIAISKPGRTTDKLPCCLWFASCWNGLSIIELTRKYLEQSRSNKQAFRLNRSFTDRLLCLTTYIEAGFQEKLKVAAAFIDLWPTYDTVWREGMIYKVPGIIPCKPIARLIDNMLNGRLLPVVMRSDSSTRKLKNDLP